MTEALFPIKVVGAAGGTIISIFGRGFNALVPYTCRCVPYTCRCKSFAPPTPVGSRSEPFGPLHLQVSTLCPPTPAGSRPQPFAPLHLQVRVFHPLHLQLPQPVPPLYLQVPHPYTFRLACVGGCLGPDPVSRATVVDSETLSCVSPAYNYTVGSSHMPVQLQVLLSSKSRLGTTARFCKVVVVDRFRVGDDLW